MKRTYKDCDKLWKQKPEGQTCEKCGTDKIIQAHHIIPRTCWPLRHDLENRIFLCKRHHLYWAHKDAVDFYNWIKTRRDMDYLESRRHNTAKNDYELIYLELKSKL